MRGGLLIAVLAIGLATGCSGQSPYCSAIERDRDTLASLGRVQTDEAFDEYVTLLREIGDLAPAEIAEDFATLADVTEDFVEAHREVGVALADREDEDKVAELSRADRRAINAATAAFNATFHEQRSRVYRHVVSECDIRLVEQDTEE